MKTQLLILRLIVWKLWLQVTGKTEILVSDDGQWYHVAGATAGDFWIELHPKETGDEAAASKWALKGLSKNKDGAGTRFRVFLPFQFWTVPARNRTWKTVKLSDALVRDYIATQKLRRNA